MTFDDISSTNDFVTPQRQGSLIKVIGVGGGGNNAVRHMYTQGIDDVSFVICNTDRQALVNSPVPTKLILGKTGCGAGNKPEVGKAAAEESAEEINRLFDDQTQMVFITAGMGGGTGTGAAPVVARLARERGLLTVGIVTIPFLFEGQRKIIKALDGADEMAKYVDALLVINNERLTEIYPDLQFMNAFGKADDTLATAARGISELITANGVINIDFHDVDTTLRDGGPAIISIGYGEGDSRVTKAINDALNSPLLKDRDILGSQRILFNIYFNPDAEDEFVMREADELTSFISNIDESVDVIWGLAHDKSLGNKVKITLLAAGFETTDRNQSKTVAETKQAPAHQPYAQSAPAAQRPAEPKITDNATAVDPARKIAEEYGTDKAGAILKNRGTQKYVVLTPDQLNDDAIIDTFESTPTFSRDRRLVDEIKNASKRAADAHQSIDPIDPTAPAEAPRHATRINFK